MGLVDCWGELGWLVGDIHYDAATMPFVDFFRARCDFDDLFPFLFHGAWNSGGGEKRGKLAPVVQGHPLYPVFEVRNRHH